MEIEEYKKLYPEANVWPTRTIKGYIKQGLLKFNEDTACSWGGPFPGNFAYFSLEDWTEIPYWRDKSISWVEANTKYFKELSEKRKRKIESLKRLYDGQVPKREQPYWYNQENYVIIDQPTVDMPIRLYMSGNDDTSYCKFYRTILEAVEELGFLEECQPLDLYKDMLNTGEWVFTN